MATAVAATTSATTLAEAGTRPRSVYYDGAAILYLLLGTGAASGTPSATNFSVKMGDGYLTYVETPFNYSGPLKGIWSAAVGSALVTEYA